MIAALDGEVSAPEFPARRHSTGWSPRRDDHPRLRDRQGGEVDSRFGAKPLQDGTHLRIDPRLTTVRPRA